MFDKVSIFFLYSVWYYNINLLYIYLQLTCLNNKTCQSYIVHIMVTHANNHLVINNWPYKGKD